MENVREAVKKLRLEHIDWTLAKIAGEVGVTRQRVSQLLHALELPARGLYIKKIKECRVCKKITPSGQVVCPECRDQYYYRTVECAFCHKSIHKRKAIYMYLLFSGQKHFYCSRACYYSNKKLVRHVED